MQNNLLIGHTGTVGSALLPQFQFQHMVNSRTISEIDEKTYSMVVCAGAPGQKWFANQHPDQDEASVNNLMNHLGKMRTSIFILISTIDVYPLPFNVTELKDIDYSFDTPAYTLNRIKLEKFVTRNVQRFGNVIIIRLPGLVGHTIKKNFLYDMKHTGNSEWTNSESSFQFFDLEHVGEQIRIAIDHSRPIVNLVSPPLIAKDIAKHCFDIQFENRAPTEVHYNVRSIHSLGYTVSKEQAFDWIRKYAAFNF